MTAPSLPELPPTTVKFLDHTGNPRPLWEEHQMRAIYLQGVQAERERAARVCEERAGTWDGDPPNGQEREWGWMRDEANNCAASIRKG